MTNGPRSAFSASSWPGVLYWGGINHEKKVQAAIDADGGLCAARPSGLLRSRLGADGFPAGALFQLRVGAAPGAGTKAALGRRVSGLPMKRIIEISNCGECPHADRRWIEPPWACSEDCSIQLQRVHMTRHVHSQCPLETEQGYRKRVLRKKQKKI